MRSEKLSLVRVVPAQAAPPWRDFLWIGLGSGLLILLIWFDPQGWALKVVRVLLGLGFVLVVPGYTFQAALFPGVDDLDGPERAALSFGLSVAVIPLITLLLDRTPWGIRLWPIIVSLAAFTLGMLAALYRRWRLPAAARFVPTVELDFKGWWAAQDRMGRVLYTILALALLTAALSAGAIVVLPRPGEHFTEFYILGAEGLAENFPRQAHVGNPVTVTVGVTNREDAPRQYRLEVWQVDSWDQNRRHRVAEAGAFVLQVGENRQWEQAWQAAWAGKDQRFDFLLFIDGKTGPYRMLRLWMDILE